MRNDFGEVTRTGNFLHVVKSLWRMALPRWVRRMQRHLLLTGWQNRPDAAEIRERVGYYAPEPLPEGEGEVRAGSIHLWKYNSHYVYDLQSFLRSWPSGTKLNFFSGDTWENPDRHTLIKTRRLDGKARNCTLLNMDSRRHFMNRVEDRIPFEEKENKLFFRGAVKGKPRRIRMMEMWGDAAFTDFGDTSLDWKSPWSAPPVSIPDHFRYRFILCLEGNDVCSSLFWVMASGCVPVMTKPHVEGWLMHGKLVAGVHYIELSEDFSDLEQKIRYYIGHPQEARLISENSKKWAQQFLDNKKERIISHLVLERYFGTVIK